MERRGIDFFPMACQQTEQMELIEAQYGLKGFAVIHKLYQNIFNGEGYYCRWEEDSQMLFSRKNGLKVTLVSEIVTAGIRRGIFSKELYDTYRILTSEWIQETYFFATQRRKKIFLKSEYLLVQCDQIPKNADISHENVYISKKNADISEQSTVEDSKVKNSTAKETEKKKNTTDVVEAEAEPTREQADRTPYKQILDLYHEICVSYPKVVKLTDRRKKTVKARLNGGYTLEDFKKLFEMAELSSFLKGNNDRGWKADFDWLTGESGMTKVLEGKYNDNKQGGINNEISDKWGTFI